MAEEPRSATRQSERLSDKPRPFGAQPASPRVLAPVEDGDEAVGDEVRAVKAGANQPETRPIAKPPANEVARGEVTKEVSKANGASKTPDGALVESLRASRSALEGLLAKTHEIHEESWRAVQLLFEDLHLRLCQEHEARAALFEKEIDERGRYQTESLLEQIDVEAEARLAARLDRVMERTKEAERATGNWIDEKIEASRAGLSEVAEAAKQELERQKAACLGNLQSEAEKRLNELKAEQSRYFVTMAQKSADTLNEHFAKRANDTLDDLQKRLQKLSDEVTSQLEKKIASLTEAAVAQIASEADVIVARETSTHLIEALRKRLDQLANSLSD